MIIHGYHTIGTLIAGPLIILYGDIPLFKTSDILPIITVSLSATVYQIFTQRAYLYNRVSIVSALTYV